MNRSAIKLQGHFRKIVDFYNGERECAVCFEYIKKWYEEEKRLLDLRKKMQEILDKFLLDNKFEKEPTVEKMLVYDKVVRSFKCLLEIKLSQYRVGIYGNGKLTEEFFYCLGDVPENVVCIID